jgi:hypothetical protein
MTARSLLLGLVFALSFSMLAAAPGRAQTQNSESVLKQWLAAMNNGDLTGGTQFLSSDFSVTMPDGTQAFTPTAGEQAIASLGTPITIISATPNADAMEIDATATFGNSPTAMSVTVNGDNGAIKSITITAAG